MHGAPSIFTGSGNILWTHRFLQQKAYPYVHDAAVYLENITRLKDGVRKLPLSSSPEYNDNSVNAWFKDWTNYDAFVSAIPVLCSFGDSESFRKEDEAIHWKKYWENCLIIMSMKRDLQ